MIVLVGPESPAVDADGVARLGGRRESGVGPSFEIPFRGGKIPLAEATVVDYRHGLELPDHGVDCRIVEAGDVHVPPDAVDRAVIGAQFPDLRLEKGQIGGGVVFGNIRFDLVVAAQIRISGMMPVHHGVVEDEGKIPLVTLLGEHPDHVPPVGRVHDVVVRPGRIPHTEAVVVLRGEDQIFHPRFLRHIQPPGRVELHRVETPGVLLVHGNGRLHALELLLVARSHAVDAPVDHQPETFIEKPIPSVIEMPHFFHPFRSKAV